MNTLQIDMYKNVIYFLNANINRFPPATSLRNAIENLNRYHVQLSDLYLQLSTLSENGTQDKTNIRKELIKQIDPVANLLKIYAFDYKKKNVYKKVQKFNAPYLVECSDMDLISAARKISKIAHQQVGYSLADMKNVSRKKIKNTSESINDMETGYGLTPEIIKNIENVYVRYIQSLVHFEDEMDSRKIIVNDIKKLHHKANNVLENNIDMFMQMHFIDDKELYMGYQKSRKIVSIKKDNEGIIQENILNEQEISQQDDNEKKPDGEETKSEGEEVGRKRKEAVH